VRACASWYHSSSNRRLYPIIIILSSCVLTRQGRAKGEEVNGIGGPRCRFAAGRVELVGMMGATISRKAEEGMNKIWGLVSLRGT